MSRPLILFWLIRVEPALKKSFTPTSKGWYRTVALSQDTELGHIMSMVKWGIDFRMVAIQCHISINVCFSSFLRFSVL